MENKMWLIIALALIAWAFTAGPVVGLLAIIAVILLLR
jgi:hypothetical protein